MVAAIVHRSLRAEAHSLHIAVAHPHPRPHLRRVDMARRRTEVAARVAAHPPIAVAHRRVARHIAVAVAHPTRVEARAVAIRVEDNKSQ